MGSTQRQPVAEYEIVIRGRVQGKLMTALEGFRVVPGRTGETRFRGEVAGPAELQRVLRRIAGCNLTLLSVEVVPAEAGSLGISPARGDAPGPRAT